MEDAHSTQYTLSCGWQSSGCRHPLHAGKQRENNFHKSVNPGGLGSRRRSIMKNLIVGSVLFATVMLAASSTPTMVSAQSSIRDRIEAAVKDIQAACSGDVQKFCGNVTRAEGRVLLCMYAHDDQLSHGCEMSLYRASRGLNQALYRVDRLADACWNEIQAQCGNADHVGQCIMDKAQSLSPPCQQAVARVKEIQDTMETSGSR
jgi:Golgi apparatus protein 1